MRIQRTDKSVLKRFLKKLAHKMNWLFSLFKKKNQSPSTRGGTRDDIARKWAFEGERCKGRPKENGVTIGITWWYHDIDYTSGQKLMVVHEIGGNGQTWGIKCVHFFSDNCPVFRSFLLLCKDLKRFMCNYFLRFPSYTPWAHCVYFLISLINHFCRKYLSPLPFVNFLQCAAISQKVLPRK